MDCEIQIKEEIIEDDIGSFNCNKDYSTYCMGIKIEDELDLGEFYMNNVNNLNSSAIQQDFAEECSLSSSPLPEREHAESSEKNSLLKCYQCAECGFSSVNRFKFKKHVKNELNKRYIRDLNFILGGISVKRAKDQQGQFKCKECDFRSKFKSSLKRHIMGKHRKIKPYSCSACSFRSLTNQNLKHHIQITHDKDQFLSCPHCNFTAVLKHHINRHVLMQHCDGPKPFICPSCDYSTVQSHHLKRHILARHSDEKPLACPKCIFRTKVNAVLQRHIQAKHIQKKHLQCPEPECPYKTIRADYLKCHIIIKHTKEKRFTCPYCSYKTAISQSLKRHVSKFHRNLE